MSLFSFSLDYFLISSWISSMSHGLFKSVLFTSQTLQDFPDILFLLISNLIPYGQNIDFA